MGNARLLVVLVASTAAVLTTRSNCRAAASYQPRLWFVGASKSGSTSLANYLLAHPLVTAVGSRHRAAAEVDLLERATFLPYGPGARYNKRLVAVEKDGYAPAGGLDGVLDEVDGRVGLRLSALAPERRAALEARGVVMYYRPHELFLPGAPGAVCSLARGYLRGAVRCGHGAMRYLVTLREPAARAVSSWWYHDGSQGKAQSLSASMAFGIAAADLLEACYNASAANVEERYRAVWARRGASESDTNFDRWSETYEVATSCSNRLLNTGTSELGVEAGAGNSQLQRLLLSRSFSTRFG